jgi:hypothetical protein
MAVFEPSLRRVARCVRWILEEETTLGCNEGVIERQRVAVAEEALQPCEEKVTLECWIDCGYDLDCGTTVNKRLMTILYQLMLRGNNRDSDMPHREEWYCGLEVLGSAAGAWDWR